MKDNDSSNVEKNKIMIVEDEAIICKDIEVNLENIGYEVVASSQTGQEAIDKAEEYCPDLILMDIQLKGKMDGIEAADIIQSSFSIPIIFLTAFAGKEKLERAKQTMPFGYLLKPVQYQNLKIAIEMALYAAGIDIKRRQAEEHLARQKKEQQTILDSVPALVFYKDTNDRFLNVNKRLVESFGLTREDIIGKTASELSPLEDSSHFADDLQVIKTGTPKTGIIEQFNTPAGVRWAETDKIPYRNEAGKIIGIIGFSMDITKRKQAEKEHQKSENRFRQLVENLPLGILIIKNDRIFYQNPKCERIMGKLPDCRMNELFKMVFAEDRESFENHLKELLSGGSDKTNFHFGLLVKSEDGKEVTEKWIQSLANLVRFQDENVLLISVVDITKTRELEKYINVQEKMSSLGRISAGIAHEIRNPLTGINTYLYSLQHFIDQESFDSDQIDLANHLIGQIKTASCKIESVIKRVIDFTKTSKPKFVQTDINQAVKDAIELSSTLLRKAGIKLKVSLTEGPLQCFADPQLMEQVVLNLINNAAKVFDETEREKKIEIGSFRKDDNTIIIIADSGPGIKPEIRQKIFEPFFSTRKDGSGIGLSIVQRIITDHRGTIKVSDNTYGGATFTIVLPAPDKGKC